MIIDQTGKLIYGENIQESGYLWKQGFLPENKWEQSFYTEFMKKQFWGYLDIYCL